MCPAMTNGGDDHPDACISPAAVMPFIEHDGTRCLPARFPLAPSRAWCHEAQLVQAERPATWSSP